MRVRLVPIPRKFVRMLMVLIMYMAVRMGYGVVRMYVFMTFGQVQPHTDSHQKCRSPEGPGSGFTKGTYRDHRTDKGRSEERRVGKKCVSTCKNWGSPEQ